MRHIVIYKPFDIVKVPFPFTDMQATKHRPALIISSKAHITNHHHCVLMMITSAKQSAWIDDTDIINLKTTGLTSPSKIRIKIFSLDIRLITDVLGSLDSETIKLVQKNIAKYLELK